MIGRQKMLNSEMMGERICTSRGIALCSMNLCMVLLAVLLSACSAATIKNGDSFDIEGGRYLTYIDKKITDEGWLQCSAVATPTMNTTEWQAAVILTIKDSEGLFSTQVAYMPNAEHHNFTLNTIESEEYTYSNTFLSLENHHNVVSFAISWQDNGNIGFFAGDEVGQQSSGYLDNPNQFHDAIVVTISGVRGQITCKGKGFQ